VRRAALAALATAAMAACSSGAKPSTSPVPDNVIKTPAPTQACADVSGGFRFTVTERDFSFEPSCLQVKAAEDLTIQNRGTVTHNFSVTGRSVDLDVPAGQDGNYEAIGGVLPAGTYDFYCKYHRARGMTGRIVVSGTFSPGGEG
jgi:plastocyanin